MNANELADYIDSGNDMWESDRELLVAALRQYAALEWLWEQPIKMAYVQRTTDSFRVSGPSTDVNYGPTITDAINNLRAKLEPRHEHVWGDSDWRRMAYPDGSFKCFERCCSECKGVQRADRLVPAP